MDMGRGLKIALIVALIIAVVSLVLNVYIYSLVTGVQNRVGAIEEQLDKEWTLVGEYTLTNSKQEETFNVSGEKWRLTWTFTQSGTGQSVGKENIRIYDENQYLIDGFSLNDKQNEKGIVYINQGQGTYTVNIAYMSELAGDYSFSFKAESYQ